MALHNFLFFNIFKLLIAMIFLRKDKLISPLPSSQFFGIYSNHRRLTAVQLSKSMSVKLAQSMLELEVGWSILFPVSLTVDSPAPRLMLLEKL